MWDTSARLLRLLSLLQMPHEWTGWTGPGLAERLGVTTRTVRKDVERLRDLGYPVHATPGVAGGYRLGAGATLPPLLLDDDEAVAVVVGLRTAAGGVAGIEETSLRALAKLEQVLPSRLRHRVGALQSHTVPVASGYAGPTVDSDVLTSLAGACRDRERLRFDYRSHEGTAELRSVEPHRLIAWGRRWYLLAWDVDRNDWRTFRVDRIRPPRTPSGPRFQPRELPSDDIAAYVSRGVAAAGWRYRARVRLLVPIEEAAPQVPAYVGTLEAIDETSCLLHTGSDDLWLLAAWIGAFDIDFVIEEPEQLIAHVRALAKRYRRASE